MRAAASANGLTFAVYAGSTGVELAWDADESLRADLLGFAVRRTALPDGHPRYLAGGIGFPGQHHEPGRFVSTRRAPIQAYRWGDYAVYPDRDYRYELIPLYAPWDGLRKQPGVAVQIRTEGTTTGAHTIAFNRAVAASQAYERRFPGVDPHGSQDARDWLARSLDDVLLGFLARAGSGWALDVVVYEYELELVRSALVAAAARGASVRIVYHAKPGDEQTAVNEANLAADAWPAGILRARVTKAICHDKVVVLSRLPGADGRREPVAVLSGSTNWTFNGLYYQANVAHAVDDAALAGRYLALFERLFAGDDPHATREWIEANDAWDSGTVAAPPVSLVLSPRPGDGDLLGYASLVRGACRSVLFATAFELDDRLLRALSGEEGTTCDSPAVLRYGLQNSASKITGYARDRLGTFTATGTLQSAPEGFVPESRHGQLGNILVHLKAVLVDFDSDQPIVITGSANFSHASSASNDENVLVIRGDTHVADVYLCELFRLFDHYRFRYNWSHGSTDARSEEEMLTRRAELDPTDAWTDRYYADPTDPHAVERTRLSRPEGVPPTGG